MTLTPQQFGRVLLRWWDLSWIGREQSGYSSARAALVVLVVVPVPVVLAGVLAVRVGWCIGEGQTDSGWKVGRVKGLKVARLEGWKPG